MAAIKAITWLAILTGALTSSRRQSQTSAAPDAARTPAQITAKIGGNVTPPRIVSDPEPEYSEEARKSGYSGTCTLSLTVNTDGQVSDIKVERPLGRGLDEKAIQAVSMWRFDPARRDGQPVATRIKVEVNFTLYGNTRETKVQKLLRRSDEGDAKAQLELAKLMFVGREVPRNDTFATSLLNKAAGHGFAPAQFLLAERMSSPTSGTPDYVSAYTWYALALRAGEKKASTPLKDLASKMTPEQLAEAQARVETWKPTEPK